MSMIAKRLAVGPAWQVADCRCTAGPGDRPFEERHGAACVAVVTEGTFQYRSTRGAALLGPRALLLGNAGESFECGHEHGVGDRCLAFHFAPEFLESVRADLPAGSDTRFVVPRLPPAESLLPLLARAEALRDDGADDDAGREWEEIALGFAAYAMMLQIGRAMVPAPPSTRDQRRIAETLRRIEAAADQPLSLAGLAHEAAMSPYHFLRTFHALVGETPHQFLLGSRLRKAAVRLRRSDASVSEIAFDAGFGDLSTFNRRFHRVMGMSPSAYRAAREGAGARTQAAAPAQSRRGHARRDDPGAARG